MEERPYANIFYFKKINRIGGTEQFLYEIAKEYHHLDITVFYDEGDAYQLKRLRKLVRCQKRIKGRTVKCRKAFFNFNIDMIDDVEAEEYIFVSHAIYQELGYKPPIHHPKLTRFVGVSRYCANKLEEYGETIGRKIKAETIYDPLCIEPTDKVIHLISATRLEDNTKGGQRTYRLIQALDKYCNENNRNYLWLIFTNGVNRTIDSPNVCVMPGRVDIRPYIADSDYLVQLSNDMETYCYSINEALMYGVPVVATPLTVLKEFHLSSNMFIECDWEMDNVDSVARRIFERKPRKFTYEPPKDEWGKILADSPSTYTPTEATRVMATEEWSKRNITDKERGIVPQYGEIWTVDAERFEELESFRERTGIVLVEKHG